MDNTLWIFQQEDVWGLFQHKDWMGTYYEVRLRDNIGNIYSAEATTIEDAYRSADAKRHYAEQVGDNGIIVHHSYDHKPPGSFMRAQGIVPWKEGDELPEDIIRRYRDAQ